MKYRQQFDETDCGAACLAMIASHFEQQLSVAQIRDISGTDTDGTDLKGIIRAASNYGLKATALKGDKNSISEKLPIPFIAHLKIEFDDIHWTYHYVVVKHIGKKKIEIWDPDPLQKKKKISYEEFFKWWTGYAVFFEPDVDFVKSDKKENLLLKFIPVFLPHKKLLFYSLLSSILLLAFGIISSFYYKYMFDEVLYSKAKFSLHTLSFGVLLVVVVQSVVSAIRSVLLSHFSFKTDLQLNFSYLSHIFKLPLSFFESRKSGEILSRLGDLDKIKQTLSSAALSGVMDVIMLVVSGPILLGISGRLFGISVVTVILAATVTFIFAKIYRSLIL